ncbi:MAG: hypothetical protein BWY57_02615 [Betaproteobacteria bacterium ADurb.Bin341]|nr:MAG: hypothetical protein BWY57_02615 [Betaproteobacteria bacterium ADurb.Bin341]
METCRLNANHVHIGVPLPGDVYDEHGQLLLSKGQILNSQAQLDHLLERGLYVELRLFEAHFKPSAASPLPVENKFDPFLVRGTMKLSLNRLLRGITDASTSGAQIVEFAEHLEAYVHTDAEAAIAACLLDQQEESRGAAHSLSSAILSALLAKRLNWAKERQRSLACAALTMNLSMMDLQQRLFRQATPLTPVQLEQVHAHPEAALAALQQIGITDPLWLKAVAQHHEAPSGKGYPQHLTETLEDGQLLRIADIFFARASARADRPPLPPAQVIRALFVEEGQGACAPLVATLVKTLGLYPPGSFVKLANSEVAVVFRSGATPQTPVAASVKTASGMPTMQPVRRDTARAGYTVAGAVAPGKVSVGYDLGKLWITDALNS